MKLYFSPGACSRVTLIALEKTKADYDAELLVFKRGEHRKPSFLKHNPSGKIPLLLVGDQALSQNPVILAYLANAYPDAGLLPSTNSLLEQHQVLSRLFRFSADLHPLVTRIRLPEFFCDIEGTGQRVKALAMEAMAFQLQGFDKLLSAQTWVSGDAWTALDAYLHWVWFRIEGAGFNASTFPNISRHYAQTLELPEVRAALEKEASAQAWLEENNLAMVFKDD